MQNISLMNVNDSLFQIANNRKKCCIITKKYVMVCVFYILKMNCNKSINLVSYY